MRVHFSKEQSVDQLVALFSTILLTALSSIRVICRLPSLSKLVLVYGHKYTVLGKNRQSRVFCTEMVFFSCYHLSTSHWEKIAIFNMLIFTYKMNVDNNIVFSWLTQDNDQSEYSIYFSIFNG